jgi:ABC-2 type transport system ATP-binding protein
MDPALLATSRMVQARGLEVSYGASQVLRGLDLDVRRGEIYALLGGNGAGKSTTLSVLLGLVKPSRGRATIDGLDTASQTEQARASLAYVPENVALYGHLSAQENLAYFLRLAGEGRRSEQAIGVALDRVGLQHSAWHQPLKGYSKGMRQKTALALALAREVPLLLLDEPNSGLDPSATEELNRVLGHLRAEGRTILMVTHDLLGAAGIADRIGFMAGGRMAREFQREGEAGFDIGLLYRCYTHSEAGHE